MVVVLNAGILNMVGTLTEGGMALDNLRAVVLGPPDTLGERKELAKDFSTSKFGFTLPAGQFEVKMERGAAKVVVPVSLAAGEVKNLSVSLNAGVLNVVASPGEGTPPLSGMAFDVFTSQKNEFGERTLVTKDWAITKGSFTLHPGDYRVRARKDGVELEVDVTIEAGRVLNQIIIFQSSKGGVTTP
jgi:Ca-activated chloride channel family protein